MKRNQKNEENIIYKIMVTKGWLNEDMFQAVGTVMPGVNMEGQCTTPEIAAKLNESKQRQAGGESPLASLFRKEGHKIMGRQDGFIEKERGR